MSKDIERCSCPHGAGMSSSIGGIRCAACRKMLTQAQVNHRLVTELHEDQQQMFRMMGALQTAGLDECGACKQWTKDFLYIGSACRCVKCLAANPEGILTEDFVEDHEDAQKQVIRFLTERGIRIKWQGEMLALYQEMTR